MIERNRSGGEIVGRSRAIADVISRIEQVAEAPSTVLITGETGTGKELVARAVHGRGARHNKPFIKVNCAAIPRRCSNRSCSGTSGARSRTHRRPSEASSRSRMGGPSSWTRSGR
jgi:DNA-binding NtrC family response regulator